MNRTKRCPTCGRDLPLCDFHTDRSRPDGLKWQCAACARKKREAAKPLPIHLSDQQFKRVYEYPPNLLLVNRLAKRYAKKRVCLRPDFRQEGWVGAWGASCTDEYLVADKIRKAVFAAYQRDYRKRTDWEALLDPATQNDNGISEERGKEGEDDETI